MSYSAQLSRSDYSGHTLTFFFATFVQIVIKFNKAQSMMFDTFIASDTEGIICLSNHRTCDDDDPLVDIGIHISESEDGERRTVGICFGETNYVLWADLKTTPELAVVQ